MDHIYLLISGNEWEDITVFLSLEDAIKDLKKLKKEIEKLDKEIAKIDKQLLKYESNQEGDDSVE